MGLLYSLMMPNCSEKLHYTNWLHPCRTCESWYCWQSSLYLITVINFSRLKDRIGFAHGNKRWVKSSIIYLCARYNRDQGIKWFFIPSSLEIQLPRVTQRNSLHLSSLLHIPETRYFSTSFFLYWSFFVFLPFLNHQTVMKVSSDLVWAYLT